MKALFVSAIILTSIVSANSQALWRQYNGPFAGDAEAFATFGDTLYAGCKLTGLFKSGNGGQSWLQAAPELTYVYSLYDADSALLIGTDRLFSYSSSRGLTSLSQQVTGVINHMTTAAGNLFVTTGDGVHRFNPTSRLFESKNDGIPQQNSTYWTRQITSIDDILFCNVLGSGLYKSADAGDTWQKVIVDLYPYGFNFMTTHNDSLFCGGDGGMLILSTDKGLTWKDIRYDIPNYHLSFFSLKVVNGDLFSSSYVGTFKLEKGQETWIKVSEKAFWSMHVYKGQLFASDQGGVYRWSADIQDFVLTNEGINSSVVNGIALFDGRIYSATQRGVHFTPNDGDDWSTVPELTDMYTKAIANTDTALFAGTNVGLYWTSKGSDKWHLSSNGIAAVPVWDIQVFGNSVYVGTDDGVHVSRDKGKSWSVLPNELSPINQMLHLGVTDSLLFAANTTGLYHLLEDSITWVKVPFFGDNEIFSLNTVGNDIYASTMNSAIYKSSDDGKTWKTIPTLPATTQVDIIKRFGNLYACDYSKVYYSSDNGETWDFWSEAGVPDVMLTCITEGDSSFYIGTYGKSIWKRPFLSLTGIDSEVYTVVGDTIYDVPDQTSGLEFRTNVAVEHGATLQLPNETGEPGRAEEEIYLSDGDQIKILAEDGKKERLYYLSRKSIVTSIPDSEISGAEIFPVPTSGTLTVRYAGTIKSCTIVNSHGKKVLEARLSDESMDVSSLPAGFYFLTIVTKEDQRQVLKFIKR